MVRSQVYGYTRESAFPIMKKINIEKDTLWSITEEDIEQYDWTNQEITLTLDATNKIWQSLGEDTLFGWVAMKQIFIVTFDNEWRFGGVIEMQGSADAIRFPVIYLDYYSTNKIIMKLCNSHRWTLDYSDCTEGIFFPEILSLFAQQGKLIK